jgi:hypothetical protein
MFGWLKRKAAQQSLFNVELNTRTLILISNRAYPDRPSSTSDEEFRAATAKVIKAQGSLSQDILLALDNGASLDEVRARILTAKGKEAMITRGAERAIDIVIDEVAAALRNLPSDG